MVFAGKESSNAVYWPYLEIDFLDPPDKPGDHCCEPIEVTFKVITEQTVQSTNPINTLMFNFSYFIVNTGTAKANVYLQTSADGYHWLINSAVTGINPDETKALVPDWIAKYSKLCYESAAAESTTLAIYLLGRS